MNWRSTAKSTHFGVCDFYHHFTGTFHKAKTYRWVRKPVQPWPYRTNRLRRPCNVCLTGNSRCSMVTASSSDRITFATLSLHNGDKQSKPRRNTCISELWYNEPTSAPRKETSATPLPGIEIQFFGSVADDTATANTTRRSLYCAKYSKPRLIRIRFDRRFYPV